MHCSVTPFEQEVLQAIAQPVLGVENGVPSKFIQCAGVRMFGDGWGGNPHYYPGRQAYGPVYPKINLALGRLAKKGLVERRAWLVNWAEPGYRTYASGAWSFTEDAKLLLGMA